MHVLGPVAGEDVKASAPRNVLLELFTATWCGGCPYADAAAEELKADYGERVSLLQYHVQDYFETQKTNERGDHYDVFSTNIPILWVDGLASKLGASSKSEVYAAYKSLLDARLAVESGLEIEISSAELVTGNITLKVNLTSPGTTQESTFNVRFVIYENDLLYDDPHPNTTFNYVVRGIEEESVSAASLPTTFTRSFAFNLSWNFSNMGAVVFAQVGDDGEVLQSHSLSFGIEDVDGDGLPDEWEMLRLETLLYSADDDPDGDYITNLQEFLDHTDPLVSDLGDGGFMRDYL